MIATINFTETGDLQFIYCDRLAPLLEMGKATVKRASHVEPAGKKWTADMSPVNGPVLGPFKLRQQALDAERAWLQDNGF